MEAVFKIIGTLCITGYIIGILFNLVNLNYTQKAIRLTAALYIITAVFIPVKNIDFFPQPDIQNMAQSIEADSTEYIMLATKNEMEKNLIKILDEKNISYDGISVHINKQSDKLYVDYIKLYGVQSSMQQKVTDCIGHYGNIIFGE